jgi:hypothetical protein
LLHIIIITYINYYIMEHKPRFRGPSLLLLAIVHVLLFAANLAVAAALRHRAPYINPFAPPEVISAFFVQNPAATRLGSFLLFGSAVPFGLFVVTTVSWLRFLKVRAAGVNITFFGGLTAAFALILSGLSGWSESLPDVAASAPLAKAIYFFSFLSGGVAYAVGFGLLSAGVSVTTFFTRHLPRWLVALGMIVAVAGEFSSLSLVTYPANFLIPITRYLGFIWMLLVAVHLTRNRRQEEAQQTSSTV